MTENTPDAPDNAKWVIVGFLAGVVMSVLALQYYGYLKMPQKEDAAVIAQFRLVSLSAEYDVRVSQKSSGKEAFCQSGYLLLRPQNDKPVAAILVDDKNRPVACADGLKAEPAEE